MVSGQLFVTRAGTMMTLPSSANNLGLECACLYYIVSIYNTYKCFFTVVALSMKYKVYIFQRLTINTRSLFIFTCCFGIKFRILALRSDF